MLLSSVGDISIATQPIKNVKSRKKKENGKRHHQQVELSKFEKEYTVY